MRLPSWEEILEKEKMWENDVHQQLKEKVSDTAKEHPLLDMAFGASLVLLPPPFGTIAHNVYNDAKGSDKDPLNAVQKYFDELKEKGQEHYETVANKLDSALIGIQDLKVIGNKIFEIQELLIGEISGIDHKIDDIKKVLNEEYNAIMQPRWEREKMAFVIGEGVISNVMSSYNIKEGTLTERNFFDICTSIGIGSVNFSKEEMGMISIIFDPSIKPELKFQFVPDLDGKMDLSLERYLGCAFNVGENYALLRDALNIGKTSNQHTFCKFIGIL
jgi:hypothetical protein